MMSVSGGGDCLHLPSSPLLPAPRVGCLGTPVLPTRFRHLHLWHLHCHGHLCTHLGLCRPLEIFGGP